MSRGKRLVDMDFDEKDEWAASVLSGYKVSSPSQEKIDEAAMNAVRISGRHLSPRARWKARVQGRLLILGFVLLIAVFAYRHIEPRVISVTGTTAQFADVVQLEAAAEIIIDAYFVGRLGSELIPTDSAEFPLVGQTYTQVRVNRVLAGTGVKLGEELVVIEPWATRRTWSGLYILTSDEYVAISPGQRYTLFLEEGPEGNWAIVGGYQGKYLPLQLESELGNDYRLAERLHVTRILPHYLELHRQVMVRFGLR